MQNLDGLIIVLTSPFRDGNLDLAALRAHLKVLLPYAVGFVLGGTTGESASLSNAELVTMLKETRAIIGSHKALFVGFWRPTIATTVEAAVTFAPLADALLVPIPKELFQQEESLIEDFYRDLANTVAAPIFLYNFPARCAQRCISVDLAARLAKQCSNIIGVKDSSEDGKLVQDIILRNLPLQAMSGNDRLLTATLALAQQQNFPSAGASMSGACSVPEIAQIEAEIYRLFKSGAQSQAEVLQQSLISTFFNLWQQYAAQLGGQSAILKYLVNQEISNYPIEVRLPLKPLSPEMCLKLKAKM